MTAEDFAAKVEWEGGVTSALDYGLKATDLPENSDDPLTADLRAAWTALQGKWDALRDEMREVEEILDEIDNRQRKGEPRED